MKKMQASMGRTLLDESVHEELEEEILPESEGEPEAILDEEDDGFVLTGNDEKHKAPEEDFTDIADAKLVKEVEQCTKLNEVVLLLMKREANPTDRRMILSIAKWNGTETPVIFKLLEHENFAEASSYTLQSNAEASSTLQGLESFFDTPVQRKFTLIKWLFEDMPEKELKAFFANWEFSHDSRRNFGDYLLQTSDILDWHNCKMWDAPLKWLKSASVTVWEKAQRFEDISVFFAFDSNPPSSETLEALSKMAENIDAQLDRDHNEKKESEIKAKEHFSNLRVTTTVKQNPASQLNEQRYYQAKGQIATFKFYASEANSAFGNLALEEVTADPELSIAATARNFYYLQRAFPSSSFKEMQTLFWYEKWPVGPTRYNIKMPIMLALFPKGDSVFENYDHLAYLLKDASKEEVIEFLNNKNWSLMRTFWPTYLSWFTGLYNWAGQNFVNYLVGGKPICESADTPWDSLVAKINLATTEFEKALWLEKTAPFFAMKNFQPTLAQLNFLTETAIKLFASIKKQLIEGTVNRAEGEAALLSIFRFRIVKAKSVGHFDAEEIIRDLVKLVSEIKSETLLHDFGDFSELSSLLWRYQCGQGEPNEIEVRYMVSHFKVCAQHEITLKYLMRLTPQFQTPEILSSVGFDFLHWLFCEKPTLSLVETVGNKLPYVAKQEALRFWKGSLEFIQNLEPAVLFALLRVSAMDATGKSRSLFESMLLENDVDPHLWEIVTSVLDEKQMAILMAEKLLGKNSYAALQKYPKGALVALKEMVSEEYTKSGIFPETRRSAINAVIKLLTGIYQEEQGKKVLARSAMKAELEAFVKLLALHSPQAKQSAHPIDLKYLAWALSGLSFTQTMPVAQAYTPKLNAGPSANQNGGTSASPARREDTLHPESRAGDTLGNWM